MVESAFIFIVFAAMLIGAFDFGQYLFIHQALVERARSAVRWGSLNNPADHASISNMVLYNQSATPPDGTPSYFNLTTGSTDAQGNQTGNVFVTDSDSGTDSYRLNIRISGYSYQMLSPYITGTYTGIPITVSVPLGQFN
jgi:Flp pilus assembly protein TadG